MATSPPFHETITLRSYGDGVCAVTHGRLDPSSRRMVFDHVADLVGDARDRLDAATVLLHGAEIYRERTSRLRPSDR